MLKTIKMQQPINSSSLFSEIPSRYGNMLSPQQQEEMKKKGEAFYNSIDFDKYRPKIDDSNCTSDLLDSNETDKHIEQIQYNQLMLAIRSGLKLEDLTDEEKNLMRRRS